MMAEKQEGPLCALKGGHPHVTPHTRETLLPNREKRRILNKTERGILNVRTAGTKVPPTPLSSRTTPWVPAQTFWTAVLAAPRGPPRSRPRLDTRQVAGHVFDVNQIPAFSEVHRHMSLPTHGRPL